MIQCSPGVWSKMVAGECALFGWRQMWGLLCLAQGAVLSAPSCRIVYLPHLSLNHLSPVSRFHTQARFLRGLGSST